MSAAMGVDPSAWHDLLSTVAGASAALLGLFFVAISLHLRVVDEHPLVRNQARVTLASLAALLAVGVTGLVPGIDSAWIGAELLAFGAVGVVVYSVGLVRARRGLQRIPTAVWMRVPLVVVLTALLMASGLSLIAHRGPGLYLLVPVLVVSLPTAVYMAWTVILSPVLRSR